MLQKNKYNLINGSFQLFCEGCDLVQARLSVTVRDLQLRASKKDDGQVSQPAEPVEQGDEVPTF